MGLWGVVDQLNEECENVHLCFCSKSFLQLQQPTVVSFFPSSVGPVGGHFRLILMDGTEMASHICQDAIYKCIFRRKVAPL
jgi:hypothetical protein